MAIITTNTSLKIGYDYRVYTVGTTRVINSVNGGLSLPFQSQFTGSITRVVLSAIITTSVTNLDIGIMGPNATGSLPSDAFLAIPNTFSASTNTTPTNYIINLDNSISVIKGQVYYLTFKPNASFTGNLSVYRTHYAEYFSAYNGHYDASFRTVSGWTRGGGQSSVIYGNSTRWFSTDIPVVPNDISPITASVNQEYGNAFTLHAEHPAIRVKSISFSNTLSQSTNPNMNFICKIYDSTGILLHTFATEDTDRISGFGGAGISYFFNRTASDIWLEPATKYYIMFAFLGTFTSVPSIYTYPYDNTLSSAGGAYSSNYANRSSDGVITDVTTELMSFTLEVNGIRFDDAYSGIGNYFYASSKFNGGLNG
jgi:hypothetical protein